MKKEVLILLLLVSVLVVSGCAKIEEKELETTGKVMKVAKYYWPGLYWVEIADKKGWFKEAGLNVEIIDTNPDWYGSLVDTVNGKIDTNNFPLFSVIDFNVKGSDMVMVINADNSFGADGIVAKQEIESIQDLKGRRIQLGVDSYQGYILSIVLERNGLTADDVILVDGKGEDIGPFLNGTVDAVFTWEPLMTEAIEKVNARRIFDTSEISGIGPEGFVFHRSFIEERPQDVQALVNVWHRTGEFIKENPREAFGIIAEIYDVTPDEVRALAQLSKILDLRDNKVSFSYAAGFESLHGVARQINDFMIEKGITDKQLDSTEFIDARFIRAIG